MADTKTRERPAAVTLTPAAEQRVADLMAKAPEDAIGVKLSTGAIRQSKTRLAQTAGRGGARAAKLICDIYYPEKVHVTPGKRTYARVSRKGYNYPLASTTVGRRYM